MDSIDVNTSVQKMETALAKSLYECRKVAFPRCMMLLHLLERDSQRVLESKKIKDPSLEIKWLKFFM
jgi:hypothetical protein